MSDLGASKLIKYTCICYKKEAEFDDESKDVGLTDRKYYHVMLALRQNGRVEVYANFEYTHAFDLAPKKRVCVDIDHDNDFFYLRYLDTREKDKIGTKVNKFYTRKVAHKWQSRIKYNFTVPVKFDSWRTVTHSKIGDYFKLYTKCVNISYYYLVAHRNFISIYDMSSAHGEGSWIRHQKICDFSYVRDIVLQQRFDPFESQQEINLRQIKGKKKDLKHHAYRAFSVYSKFQLMVFYGAGYIRQMRILQNGRLADSKLWKSPGAIVSIQDDEHNHTGCLLIVKSKGQPFEPVDLNQQLTQLES